jgi:two-component system, chemotaxis family, chemotaxis protein CheY
MRILVAEDDNVAREVLVSLLSGFGTVEALMDGSAAIAAVKRALDHRRHYDIICLDIMMPGTDGKEALAAIRRLESDNGLMGNHRAAVVMTTAVKDAATIVGAFREEADGYLVKPVTRPGLYAALRKAGVPSVPDDA